MSSQAHNDKSLSLKIQFVSKDLDPLVLGDLMEVYIIASWAMIDTILSLNFDFEV